MFILYINSAISPRRPFCSGSMRYSKFQTGSREISTHEGGSSIYNKLLMNPKRGYEGSHDSDCVHGISWLNWMHLKKRTWKAVYINQTLVLANHHWVETSFVVNVYSFDWIRYFFTPLLIGSVVLIISILFLFFYRSGKYSLDFVSIYTIQAYKNSLET